MGKAIYTLGNGPTVSIKRCGGDLKIEGRTDETVTVATDTMPHSVQGREQLVIEECDDDLRLYVPRGATVIVDHVDGDAHVDGLPALEMGGVGGDLELRAIGRSCAVRSVDGDMQATDVAELTLGTVGGDLHLERVTGRLALERTGGDATLRGAFTGFGPAHIGGDLTLDTSFAPGQEYRATVDGDTAVYVPEDADLTLNATVDGDVSGVARINKRGAVSATWGDGSAHLTLTVGGDLQVRRTGATASRSARVPVSAGSAANTVAPATPQPSPTPQPAPMPQPTPAPQPAPEQPSAQRPQGVEEENMAKAEKAPAADSVQAVLEAVARGDISPAEADDLLSGPPRE